MKFAIIGFGEYAQEQHLPNAQKYGTVAVIADLAHNEEKARQLCPNALFLNAETLSPENIAEKIRALSVNACILSTPPQIRKPYLKALLEQHTPVYCDKPLTFPFHATEDVVAARTIWQDYQEVLLWSRKQKTPVWIHAQRRFDHSLQLLKQEAKGKAPLCYLEITKADGQQNTAIEMNEARTHGYVAQGMMAHSAYHYIDYIMQLFNEIDYDEITVETKTLRANDFAQTEARGELNAYITLQAQLQGTVVCTARLSLLHTGVSARDVQIRPTNWSKQSGRIKQEQLMAQFGHDSTVRCERLFAPDGFHKRKHVKTTCTVFRNPSFGKSMHETDTVTAKNTTRDRDFQHFIRLLKGKKANENLLQTHERSLLVYSNICESLAREHIGLPNKIQVAF
jgi:predicted dehydrogenase